jgi:hypothetical protein
VTLRSDQPTHDFVEVSATMPWFRGNLHTHTTNSDGDSPPDVVVSWYRDAGYDFLVITDHDFVTLPSDHTSVAGRMLLVAGEEVSAGSIHVNGLGITGVVEPRLAESGLARDTLQANVDAVRAAGGVPTVNHPNFRWQLQPSDLLSLRGCGLFEVHNAGPETNNAGKPGHPSHEELWDLVLSSGRRFFGVAVDDAHHFRSWGRPYSNPGRAWVVVDAASLDEAAILESIDSGAFYASTGVALHAIAASRDELALDIEPHWDLAYRTTFVGMDGRVLDVVDGVEPRFRLSDAPAGYVRARVDDSDGLSAWVQPAFTT